MCTHHFDNSMPFMNFLRATPQILMAFKTLTFLTCIHLACFLCFRIRLIRPTAPGSNPTSSKSCVSVKSTGLPQFSRAHYTWTTKTPPFSRQHTQPLPAHHRSTHFSQALYWETGSGQNQTFFFFFKCCYH